jgi:transposase
MATPDYWAEPPLQRQRAPLYFPTLDGMIADDDPVRLVDEVLAQVDWSAWEAEYSHRGQGQPPIHPRCPAAAILYGLIRGIRSSRRLEEACCYRFDFIWLLEGRRLDHTTLSKFRVEFREPLKDLFRQLGRIALTLGLIRLGDVAFDATRVRAYNSRFKTRTAKTLEEKLRALDELFERLMADAGTSDAQQADQGSPTHLPEELAECQRRREQVRALLEQARAADRARQDQGIDPQKNPAQVPTTDPDSRVMPNKEGGYAPNYTPVVTTDGQAGFIVDVDVLAQVNETGALAPAVDRIQETFDQKPENMLTDAGNNSGQVQQEMEQRGVAFYAPVSSAPAPADHPAYREDPRQAVAEARWPELPRNAHGQLDKSCFLYVDSEDQYYCPQGQPLPFEKTKPDERGGERIQLRVYRCAACGGCPLAAACLSSQSRRGRTITRDPYEEVRERTAARMATESGRQRYRQRGRIAETPFAILKSVMGLRQFLLRGLEKVKTEWRWAATAFNLGKLMRYIGRLRARLSLLNAEV